ncbi:unnamed protein product, partial [Mesorhabditis belari]|uniref:Uncharacterized protein n=1 Tax=Mesorhabditis belari TaxID=2138241 RepID=A0AAF3FFX6_9BILA
MSFLVQAVGYFNTDAKAPENGKHDDFHDDGPLPPKRSKKEELVKRSQCIGSKCQIFYKDDPLMVSRASMQYVYDEFGHRYLDCISNVQHVGHCHPTVVESISKQLATSTCNVRFVSSQLTDCAEQILATLPGLDTVLFCNSGSEANDLALRLARDFSKHTDAIVVDHAYHGHVTTTMEMSPYKFDHGSSVKQPEWCHVTPCPDVYRGKIRLSDADLHDKEKLKEAGVKYAEYVKEIIDEAVTKKRSVAAFFSEALQSCGGQVIPPETYFPTVAKHIHGHGGVVVIDEVQTGFGRVGSTFWAHQVNGEGFVPDIVTMGKPMGNGFPVSAVVTRKEIADTLGGSVGYFNTYGGNPVACAAVLGVLKVIKEENLLQHSEDMGAEFKNALTALKEKHECIGDVRGLGQFWGVDLVKSRETREPDTKLALALILKLRQERDILLNADGPHENILKFKPPLCFNKENLHEAVSALDVALTQMGH